MLWVPAWSQVSKAKLAGLEQQSTERAGVLKRVRMMPAWSPASFVHPVERRHSEPRSGCVESIVSILFQRRTNTSWSHVIGRVLRAQYTSRNAPGLGYNGAE
jgi:hypothetical protein